MSRRVLFGGRVIGSTASRASVFVFIDVPKPTITQRPYVFQGRPMSSTCLGSFPGAPAAIFFELFEVERFVLGITAEPTINGMTRIAHRDLAHKRISQEVYQSGQAQRAHRNHWLASSEEVNTHG